VVTGGAIALRAASAPFSTQLSRSGLTTDATQQIRPDTPSGCGRRRRVILDLLNCAGSERLLVRNTGSDGSTGVVAAGIAGAGL
jgi:hypothetical protein